MSFKGLFLKQCHLKITKIQGGSYKDNLYYKKKYDGYSIKVENIERHDITNSLWDNSSGVNLHFKIYDLAKNLNHKFYTERPIIY